jgi:hypothetical protein
MSTILFYIWIFATPINPQGITTVGVAANSHEQFDTLEECQSRLSIELKSGNRPGRYGYCVPIKIEVPKQ